jgi:sugar phosphate isomerase/epimerase
MVYPGEWSECFMKISLGSWAFSFGPFADNPVPFERTVQRLSTAGYDGIEICGFPPHITLDRYPDAASRRGLVSFLRDNRLGVSGYAADFTCVNPVTPGNKQKYLDLFQRNTQMCVDIGSPAIRVDSIAAPGSIDERDYQGAFGRLADVWNAAAAIAQNAGIRMVWEFEPGFAFNKPSEVVAMHTKVAHPNFRLLFDTAHAYMCSVAAARQHGARETLPGGVREFLRRCEGRIGAIHVIDSDGTLHGNETSTHRPFGQGKIDFDSLAPRLLSVPDIEWWCIDMCFWAGSWELVESSLAFVRQFTARAVA